MHFVKNLIRRLFGLPQVLQTSGVQPSIDTVIMAPTLLPVNLNKSLLAERSVMFDEDELPDSVKVSVAD